MENKDLKLCVDTINKNKTAIEKAFFKELGITCDIKPKIAGNITKVVEIYDASNDVDKKMRSNKLLRNVFSEVNLWGHAWMEEETGSIYFNVQVSYRHPSGGSNGIEIGRFKLYSNGKVKRIKY